MENPTINEFKEEFLKIKQMGWIPSNRFHDTGIGKTFEDFIRVIENNKSSADYKDTLELKSARELSDSIITLFTKSPEPLGINSKLRERFGYYDEEHKDLKILHTTFSNKFNTCRSNFCFSLEVSDKDKKIRIKIRDMQDNDIKDIEAYYPFNKLKKIIETKIKAIIFIGAESKKENGQEYFKFNKAVLLTGLTFDKFILLVKGGIILYDIRLGVFRSGDKKGQNHDHGSGFRIHKADLSKAFNIQEL